MAGVRPSAVVAAAAVRAALTSARTVAALAALGLAAYVYVYGSGLVRGVLRADGFSYYVYLPSWFLHGDLTLAELARDCCGGAYRPDSGIQRWPGTRRWLNAHPIGVAIMQAPFFLVAHALTRWTNLSPDGFSLYYQHAAGISGLFWAVGGLAVLRRLLLDHFADATVAVTLAALILGTNLLHYATFDASYSHVYSFFLFAALLYVTTRWYELPSLRLSVLLGLLSGLIVLVRHPNIVLLAVFPLYGVSSFASLRARITFLAGHRRLLTFAAGAGIAIVVPQLVTYWLATGRPLVSAYGEVGFNWSSPRLYGVLFSVTKGVFFWSPLLLLALAGWAVLARSANPLRSFVPAFALIFAVHTYVIAAWWDWQLGGSYGSRGYVDLLPSLAIGLAAVLSAAWTRAGVRAGVLAMVAACVALSMFQMLQYWHGMIEFDDMTWDKYRQVFLRWR